jgi:glycine/D-amino acid oxidase-like deaminating enzyme
VKFCKGAIHTREKASLKPYSLVTSLLQILVQQHSLQLHTRTAATSISSPSQHTKYYTIHTKRGVVKTRHIVNATNAWIGHLYPEFQGKIVPTRGQVIQVDKKDIHLGPMDWNYGGEYLIQRPDSSLVFGGGRRFSSASSSFLLSLT